MNLSGKMLLTALTVVCAHPVIVQTQHKLLSGIPKPAFSPMLTVGDTVYVSGTLGRSANSQNQSREAEARIVLDNIKAGLQARGLTMDDLVSVQVFSTDLGDYDTFNQVYRLYFHGALPARAFIGINHLLFGAHFEVMGIAAKGASSKKLAEP